MTKENNDQFYVKFWGTRGSLACPGDDYAKYGGNTSCVEVNCDGIPFIFDAGSGIRPLGFNIIQDDEDPKATHTRHLFLSHTHFDHICGLPFFAPFFKENYHIHIWAGHLYPEMNLEVALSDFMKEPFFPVPYDIFQSQLTFHDFHAGENYKINDEISIQTALLNHPNRATGYRLNYKGHSVCYVTDTEHIPGKPDEAILNLIEGTDVFIYDASYSDEQFSSRIGWGHSTWQEGCRLAKAANVKTYVPFHHDICHRDAHLDLVQAQAKQVFSKTEFAKEGEVLSILGDHKPKPPQSKKKINNSPLNKCCIEKVC